VGEELRTIGGEGMLEWRGDGWSLEATAALYGVNDPAGILMAERGWAFGDRPTGLFDRSRLPDTTLRPGMPGPIYSVPFQEIDGRVGWYTGLAAKRDGVGRVSLLYYDNSADGAATTGQFAWHTNFWAAGIETDLEPWVVKAQAMVGATEFSPLGQNSHTDFQAAYVLVGYDWGTWRLAGRGDWFRTDGYAPRGLVSFEEHGYAATVALSWLPRPWLRVTGEVLYVDSTREQRQLAGVPENSRDTQVQLALRLFY
ncbi:MAG: hypothetical protein JO021_06685, partial [Alphaproteobacteria bacterium]|nr:hypothetical protein [Alphaproteobacteria bacterium]